MDHRMRVGYLQLNMLPNSLSNQVLVHTVMKLDLGIFVMVSAPWIRRVW